MKRLFDFAANSKTFSSETRIGGVISSRDPSSPPVDHVSIKGAVRSRRRFDPSLGFQGEPNGCDGAVWETDRASGLAALSGANLLMLLGRSHA
jgi:hypothetical protein